MMCRQDQASNEALGLPPFILRSIAQPSREGEAACDGDEKQSSKNLEHAGGSESRGCSNQSVRKGVWRPVASAASGLGATLLWMDGGSV